MHREPTHLQVVGQQLSKLASSSNARQGFAATAAAQALPLGGAAILVVAPAAPAPAWAAPASLSPPSAALAALALLLLLILGPGLLAAAASPAAAAALGVALGPAAFLAGRLAAATAPAARLLSKYFLRELVGQAGAPVAPATAAKAPATAAAASAAPSAAPSKHTDGRWLRGKGPAAWAPPIERKRADHAQKTRASLVLLLERSKERLSI